MTVSTTVDPQEKAVVGQLSTLDRFLPVWIGVARVVGLLLGRGAPDLGDVLEAVQVDGISLPIAVGLLVMMYPVLAKVRYDRMGSVTRRATVPRHHRRRRSRPKPRNDPNGQRPSTSCW